MIDGYRVNVMPRDAQILALFLMEIESRRLHSPSPRAECRIFPCVIIISRGNSSLWQILSRSSSMEVCFGTCLLLGIHLRTISSSPKVYAAPNTQRAAKLTLNSSLAEPSAARSSNKRQAFAVIKTKDPRRKTTVAGSGGKTTQEE